MISAKTSLSFALAIGVCVGLVACAPEETTVDPRPSEDAISIAPVSNYVYQCLTDKGWDVTLTWDGGIEVSSETIPEAQIALYDADSEECWSVIDGRVASMQDDEIAGVYRDELTTRDCLIEQGYEVEPPPSEQLFVESFRGARWSAYGGAEIPFASLTEDAWRKLNVACPQPAWSLGAP